MKDGIIKYKNNKVLVNDFTDLNFAGEEIEYDYQDNIKDILLKENIIEELEILKENINTKIAFRKRSILNIKQMKKTFTIISIILGILCISGITLGSVSLGYGVVKSILIGALASGFTVGLSSYFILSGYNSLEIRDNHEIKGYELEKEQLENELNKNKNTLDQLRNKKEKKFQKQMEEKKYENINDIHLDELKSIKDELLLYFEIGENEDRLSKYYNKNKLEKKLDSEYSKDEIEKIKTYFKRK